MRSFEWNHIPALFYDSNCKVCFLLPKCVFFYQWCLSGLSSQHYVSMIFVLNSVGKKMHTLPRCGLIFSFQMPYCLHWLFSSTLFIQLKPLKPQNKLQKKSRALPSSSCRGWHAPDPANQSSEKMTSQLTLTCFLLCVYVLPQKHNKFTPAF